MSNPKIQMEAPKRITIDEAIRRGYEFGPCGVGRIAPLTFIQQFSLSTATLYVSELDKLKDEITEPEPAGDIPLML